MNKYDYVHGMCALRRAAFFSLVTAPALALFVCFVMLSFNNSIAGSFLSEARKLVAGAPEGKVNISAFCQQTYLPETPQHDTSDEPVKSIKPAPPVLKPEPVICKKEIIWGDAEHWRKDTDRIIRNAYLFSVFMGLGVWLFLNGFPRISLPRGFFWRKKK
ncbi:hypothetical protein AM352_24175 (plasmid) [Citrobacter koseri]|uniref:hypothetical protein n=1 Tax=Citrobacter koseri TaxID=545 RepID=UPI000CE66ED6|nr:hypothetical protein [Citrobacter koseri]AVE61432.1 hypothetical protein AM352_24175 [Citrobacter koseri]